MTTVKVPMTKAGFDHLTAELHKLKNEGRPNVIRAIAEAREHGDLSENAEYAAAREKQGFIEGRIKELESKLARAEVLDPTRLSGDRVTFGAAIELTDLENDQVQAWVLVGEDEADLAAGKLSVTSPVARAALGRKVGDILEVRTPAGVREFELTRLRFQQT